MPAPLTEAQKIQAEFDRKIAQLKAMTAESRANSRRLDVEIAAQRRGDTPLDRVNAAIGAIGSLPGFPHYAKQAQRMPGASRGVSVLPPEWYQQRGLPIPKSARHITEEDPATGAEIGGP